MSEQRQRAVRFSDAEWAQVKDDAKRHGRGLNEEVRGRVLASSPAPSPSDVALELQAAEDDNERLRAELRRLRAAQPVPAPVPVPTTLPTNPPKPAEVRAPHPAPRIFNGRVMFVCGEEDCGYASAALRACPTHPGKRMVRMA